MRRILTVLIIAALITGYSWGKKISPGWAQEQKPLTLEQQQILQILKLKQQYGRELVLSSSLGRVIVDYENQANALRKEVKNLKVKLKTANAKIAQLEMALAKIELGWEKNDEKSTGQIHPYDVAPGEAIDVPQLR